jgi:hypothetical protein
MASTRYADSAKKRTAHADRSAEPYYNKGYNQSHTPLQFKTGALNEFSES